MQITFLVGNGFDISCGIDTSYESFYRWYVKQPSTNNEIMNFKKDINSYLEGESKRWSDFESGLGQYSQVFTPETSQGFIDVYEDAHDGIIEYISSERNKFNSIIDTNTQAALSDGILNFTQELTPSERDTFARLFNNDKANDTIVKFITFNYTDTMDICVNELSKNPLKSWQCNGTRKFQVSPKVLHIHGTVDHYPILGVCAEEQFANKELMGCPNISEIVLKSKSVQAMGEHWYSEAESEINNSLIICIWGMSLGETDSIWWYKIAEWLKANAARQLVIFWHTKTPPNGKSIYKFVSERSKIIDQFAQYSSFTVKDIDQIKNRIHIIYNTGKVLRVPMKKKETLSVLI